MKLQSLQTLLTEISAINKKYESISKISGENFNIFNLLGLCSSEISHSKIIAMLLDPKGMHGKGSVFLKMFLEQILEINGEDFSACANDVSVELEKFIGKVTDAEGGRTDIAIKSGGKWIFIENKIYADDQQNQLLRYNNGKPYGLIYLTLDGRDAGETSTGGKELEYKRLSYKSDILKWLELCKKETADNPLLRETLSQYIILIKQLTGQARSHEMEKEIFETLTANKESVEAALLIANNIDQMKYELLKRFEAHLQNIANDKGLSFLYRVEDRQNIWWDFYKEEWEELSIQFGLKKDLFKELEFGFPRKPSSSSRRINKDGFLHNYLKEKYPLYENDEWWAFNGKQSLSYTSEQVYFMFLDNNSEIFYLISKKLSELLQIVEQIEKEKPGIL